jgi:hypothetical protein
MTKRSFQISNNAIDDIMTQQTGVIKKAWLESIMNSVDADATEITFDIDEQRTKIYDNGNSISEEQIERTFQKFGAPQSADENKEFGRFRMGRGQMFAFGTNIWRIKNKYLVVDIENETTTVTLPECTDTSSEAIISNDGDTYELDTAGMDFVMLDAEQYNAGTSIEIQHYQTIDDVDDTVDEFRQYIKYIPWMHDVGVTVNDTEILAEPDVIKETELAWYIEEIKQYGTNSSVYNKGAYVDDFNLGPVSVAVLSKGELDVTISRTDILDTDDYWQNIKHEHRDVVVAELKKKNNPSRRQRQWMLRQAAEDSDILSELKTKEFIKDVNGNSHSISDVTNEEIGFAPGDDKLAQKTMKRTGTIILDEKQKSAFDELVQSAKTRVQQSNISEYTDIIGDKLKYEMKEVPREQLSKRRKTNLGILSSALEDVGITLDVKAGYSNHKQVWQDDSDTLYIHKDDLNENRQRIATEVFFQAVIVGSHDGETMSSLNEDYNLKSSVYQVASGLEYHADCDLPTAQYRILNGHY